MVDCASSQSILLPQPMAIHRLSSKDLRGYSKPSSAPVNKYKRTSNQGAPRHLRSNQDPDTPRSTKETLKPIRKVSGEALAKPVGRASINTPKHLGTPKPNRSSRLPVIDSSEPTRQLSSLECRSKLNTLPPVPKKAPRERVSVTMRYGRELSN